MIPSRTLLLAAAAACVAVAPAAAQDAVPGVDGRRIQPGADSMAVYVVRGTDTIPIGFTRDELAAVTDAAGGTVLQRVYTTHARFLGDRVDSIFDRLETLSPVRQRSVERGGGTSLDFAPGRVTGTVLLVSGQTAAVNVALRGGVYNAMSFDLVLRAADLHDGWNADVPAFIASTRDVTLLHASVRGVETVGGRACWRVAASFAGTPVTFWIDQETRQMRQQVMEIGPDTRILIRVPTAISTPSRSS